VAAKAKAAKADVVDAEVDAAPVVFTVPQVDPDAPPPVVTVEPLPPLSAMPEPDAGEVPLLRLRTGTGALSLRDGTVYTWPEGVEWRRIAPEHLAEIQATLGDTDDLLLFASPSAAAELAGEAPAAPSGPQTLTGEAAPGRGVAAVPGPRTIVGEVADADPEALADVGPSTLLGKIERARKTPAAAVTPEVLSGEALEEHPAEVERVEPEVLAGTDETVPDPLDLTAEPRVLYGEVLDEDPEAAELIGPTRFAGVTG
jgi:hypothetical protein